MIIRFFYTSSFSSSSPLLITLTTQLTIWRRCSGSSSWCAARGILQCACQCSGREWRRSGHIPLLIELDPLLQLLQALCRLLAGCALVVAHVLVAAHHGGHLRAVAAAALPVHRLVVVITFEALLAAHIPKEKRDREHEELIS